MIPSQATRDGTWPSATWPKHLLLAHVNKRPICLWPRYFLTRPNTFIWKGKLINLAFLGQIFQTQADQPRTGSKNFDLNPQLRLVASFKFILTIQWTVKASGLGLDGRRLKPWHLQLTFNPQVNTKSHQNNNKMIPSQATRYWPWPNTTWPKHLL